ncbi:NAD-dependent epimerase/dehydratase family protein [Deminuibacter soli]|uniref:NAD(P)-dependent oxidoreductase n=1 Tax=Deminuibacter soli TaxID=2291815 RepID=A0A3E1NFT3_9BACT|nr:NAD(P)-dependent oxidoreductase [Deminuibacter soli]RFM26648.1 NAD(P)-dependent oxidoreductase [Deminuibacter soli]
MTKFLITGGNGFIGTNFIEMLRYETTEAYAVTIVDIQAPKIPLNKNETWVNVNILDRQALEAVYRENQPDIVFHLAAETACLPHMTLSDYPTVTTGSQHVFELCEQFKTGFLVHTSTQFVHQGNGQQPVSDIDYAPHTVYGEAKVIAEKQLRNGNYNFNWSIIRPTNVWGPWHLRYPYEFWKVLRNGKYFHPGRQQVIRSYGFVNNVCLQVLEIIKRKNEAAVSRQTFYVGDAPMNLFEWVNAFSIAINRKPVRVIPSGCIYALAVVGSGLQQCGISFPITLSRYKSMTQENPAPMEKTFSVLGQSRFSLQEGVKITTDWLVPFWNKEKI